MSRRVWSFVVDPVRVPAQPVHIFKIACLSSMYPEWPLAWKREFPVFGAVSGTVGCLGVMEVIKIISGLVEPLAGRLLTMDFRTMSLWK